MKMLEEYLNQFYREFNGSKIMVLSSSYQDKVSSRMMSIIQMEGKFYFQTDKTFRKYNQLIQNPNVSLCIENIQIEGSCVELGKPSEYPKFCEVFKKMFEKSFLAYSHLENERLFEITPIRIERWIYKENTPFIEIFDLLEEKHLLIEYKGE
ncbi:pyridoxamine 5'-phosphate oxidase family protein [Anaerorhabdus sp.]|uniref:pyridoxamine 5'-phosphate oxidase family protein n=1 Tax=Anaerorhabdus sp. TaxID=1872524 RepID=UPI002FCA2281